MPFSDWLTQVTNGDGTWVRLDQDSMARYCHETSGEAWSLARGTDDILYLQHETDLLEDAHAQENQSPFNFGQSTAAGAQASAGQCGIYFYRPRKAVSRDGRHVRVGVGMEGPPPGPGPPHLDLTLSHDIM